MSIPALNTGLNGISLGLGNLRRDASAIAQAVGDTQSQDSATQSTDVAASLVNLKLDTLQVQASVKVVETVHDIIGSLLDVTA